MITNPSTAVAPIVVTAFTLAAGRFIVRVRITVTSAA